MVIINVLGLFFNITGVYILYKNFLSPNTDKFGNTFLFNDGELSPKYRKFVRNNRIGLFLIITGFAFQVFAIVIIAPEFKTLI